MPADSIAMRDRYCDLRWKSLNLIKKQGVIIDYKLLREAHRWRSQIQIDLDPVAFALFAETMDAEYRSRFEKSTAQQKLDFKERGTPEKLESTPTVEEDDLSSERFGANYYVQLRDLLKAEKWKEADRETGILMLKVMNRWKSGYLKVEHILNFPYEDWQHIDRLWVKYSNGQFGFSVQKKIWRKCGKPREYNVNWEKFGDRIGWRNKGTWIWNTRIAFDTSTPEGHFPLFIYSKCSGGFWLILEDGETVYVDQRRY